MGPVDRGRRTQGRGEEPQLPGHLRAVLAQPQRGGRRRHLRGARHALLRQGRAEPGDPCRPRLAGLRIQRCGRIREIPDAPETAFRSPRRGPAPASGRGRGLHPLVQRRGLRVHPLQPGAGAPGRPGAPGQRAAPADPRRTPGEPRPDALRRAGRRPPASGRRPSATAPEPGLDSRRSLSAARHLGLAARTRTSAQRPTAARCWPASNAGRATSTWSASMPPDRCSVASPTPGAPSAGMPAAASTSTGACSMATARR